MANELPDKQYGCGPVEFSGADDALDERHLLFDNVVDPAAAGPRDRYDALDTLAKELQRDGAKAFVDSWYELIDVIASRSAVLDRARCRLEPRATPPRSGA